MIRGINRQVVEVKDTGCDYFEKIMFFVKPEYAAVSEGKIRERAGIIAGNTQKPPVTKLKKDKRIEVLKICGFLLAGFVAGIVVGAITGM